MPGLELAGGVAGHGACAGLRSWEEGDREHEAVQCRVFGGYYLLLLVLGEWAQQVLTSFFVTLYGQLWMAHVLVQVFGEFSVEFEELFEPSPGCLVCLNYPSPDLHPFWFFLIVTLCLQCGTGLVVILGGLAGFTMLG